MTSFDTSSVVDVVVSVERVEGCVHFSGANQHGKPGGCASSTGIDVHSKKCELPAV